MMMRMAGSVIVLAIVPLMAWRSPVGAGDVAALRKQVDALDAETNTLEARLAAIERHRLDYGGQVPASIGPGGTSIIRAPFEVQDEKGKPILRVVERGVASRGLYVFNEQGNVAAQVAVLSDSGGGRVFVYPGTQPLGGVTVPAYAAIAYPDTGPTMWMLRTDGKPVASITGDGFAAFNKNGIGVASMGARPASGAGYLTLGEPGGSAIVEAGVLPDGRGVVRAYPLGGKPPIPVPNLLMGARTK
jgi:hypothetical protein